MIIFLQTKCLLGVRAEDWMLAENVDSSYITAKVDYVERVGRDSLLHAKIGELTIRALVSPEFNVQNDDTIKLSIRKDRLHLFDTQTEMNVVVSHS